MKTVLRALCGITGALLIVTAAQLVFFMAAAAFGSYYDGASTLLGVVPGPLFTLGRHLVARCFPGDERRPVATTISDYVADTLAIMGVISGLDGIWGDDAVASTVAIMLLLGAVGIYAHLYLLPWIGHTSNR